MAKKWDLEALAKQEMERINRDEEVMNQAFMLCRKDQDGSIAPEDAPFSLLIAMPNLSDAHMRLQLQDMALKNDGFIVAVVKEVWEAHAAVDDTVGALLIKQAHAEGTIHELPDAYRSEAIRVDVESETEDLRQWRSNIKRVGDKRMPEPWHELVIQLPRPGFKRYLPERTADGKRIIKIPRFY